MRALGGRLLVRLGDDSGGGDVESHHRVALARRPSELEVFERLLRTSLPKSRFPAQRVRANVVGVP